MNISKLIYNRASSFLLLLGFYENRTCQYTKQIGKYLQNSLVIVDVGCGKSTFGQSLENGKRLIIVLDVDINILRTSATTSQRVCGDAQCLPFRDGSVDCVLSLSVMEHLDKPEAHAREIYRVLKDKSVTVVQLPNLQYFFEPHSKWPLLSFLPRSVQSTILGMLGYAYINMDLTSKKALKLLTNQGLQLNKSIKLYHSKIMELFPFAPSYLYVFTK